MAIAKLAKPAVAADPERPLAVLEDGPDVLPGEVGSCFVGGKFAIAPTIQPTPKSPDPEASFFVLLNGEHRIAA